MAETSFLKRRWKLIVNLVTLLALIVLLVAIRGQLKQTFHDLFRINAWAVLLIIPIEFLNYDAQARLYQGLFKIVGNKLPYRFLFNTSLELNFVNSVFPSGGVTGISYFGVRMRGTDITGAKATLVHLMKLVMLFLSFEILIALGVVFLAAEGHMNSLILLLAGVLTTSMLVGTALFAYIIGTRERIAGFFTWVTRMLNKLIHLIRRGHHDETINIERARAAFDDLHENYMLIRKDLRSLRGPFIWALLANFWEIMAVYIVYVASGVPSRLSLPVTVMYRVVNTLVQLPPGYYYYHRTLHRAKNPAKLEA
jgi:uncharacterized membrane protein YbhN (UPF0104 family)